MPSASQDMVSITKLWTQRVQCKELPIAVLTTLTIFVLFGGWEFHLPSNENYFKWVHCHIWRCCVEVQRSMWSIRILIYIEHIGTYSTFHNYGVGKCYLHKSMQRIHLETYGKGSRRDYLKNHWQKDGKSLKKGWKTVENAGQIMENSWQD